MARNGVVRKQVVLLASSTGSRFTGNASELLHSTARYTSRGILGVISACPIFILLFFTLTNPDFPRSVANKIYTVARKKDFTIVDNFDDSRKDLRESSKGGELVSVILQVAGIP